MRRLNSLLMVAAMLVVGVTGCTDDPQTLPTVAALPTVTATSILPTATVVPPTMTDEPFFTPTPADDPIEFASPTPEAIATLDDAFENSGPCSSDALTQAIVETGWTDLMAQQTTLVTAFSDSGATLNDWLLANADAMAMVEQPGTLPLTNMRYRRSFDGGVQELFVLLSPAAGAVGDYFTTCLADESFFRQGDVSPDAVITIETLSLGDAASLAMVTEAVSFESSDTGISELTTNVYSVLVGDVLIQALSIPALDEAMGLTAVPQADILALLDAIIAALPA